jgi:NADPH:quinone reductase-like Zn-dependent oxidoreductase
MSSYRKYTINDAKGIDSLSVTTTELPTIQDHQILVKIRAVSLNYRDLMIIEGRYFGLRFNPDTVPVSDGSGQVVQVGSSVSEFKAGDRVVATFMERYDGGRTKPQHIATSIGGQHQGVLTEYRVFDEQGLVKIPDHLSYEEAATLPCAGVTAWNALFGGPVPLKAGQSVLVLGTGGVSIFAAQLAIAAGARVIGTSSSEAKIAKLNDLGVTDTINYKSYPDWENEVLALTDGRGVDQVVEVGGAGTLSRSVGALAQNGFINLIGVLSSGNVSKALDTLMIKTGYMRGIMIGSRENFEDLNRALSLHKIHPVIDKVFSFDDAPNAYQYLQSAGHFGKVVIKF